MKHLVKNKKAQSIGITLLITIIVALAVLGIVMLFAGKGMKEGWKIFKCDTYSGMKCSSVKGGLKISILGCYDEEENLLEAENCYLTLFNWGGEEDEDESSGTSSPLVYNDTDTMPANKLFYKNIGGQGKNTEWIPINKWEQKNNEGYCKQVRNNVGVEITNLDDKGSVKFKGIMASNKITNCDLFISALGENAEYFSQSHKVEINSSTVTDGKCIVEGTIEFTGKNENIFNLELWNFQRTVANCFNYAHRDRANNYAMFMLEMTGWKDKKEKNQNLVTLRTLIDVPQLIEKKTLQTPVNPELFNNVVLTIEKRNILGQEGMGSVCDVYCKATKSGDDNVYPCEFVGLKIQKTAKCPNNLLSKPPEAFKADYSEELLAENGEIVNSVINKGSAGLKVCAMGFATGTTGAFAETALDSGCSKIYYVNPEKNSPSDTCDINTCGDISNKGGYTEYEPICNEIHKQVTSSRLGYENTGLSGEIFSNYFITSATSGNSHSFCSNTNTKYQCFSNVKKESGLFNNDETNYDCVSCARKINTCESYVRQSACIANPCLPAINCYWRFEDEEEYSTLLVNACKQCPDSNKCYQLDSKYECEQCSNCEWKLDENMCGEKSES